MSIEASARRLLVSIVDQAMVLVEGGAPPRRYPVSTSAAPPSCLQDSLGTPLGLHRIAAKIGAGARPGSVFKGRVASGLTYSELPPGQRQANRITSRILRLAGLEPGRNSGPACDSFARYIYIHGTNHEERVGRPFSGGCIEMLNADVIALYDRVDEGDLVYIEGPDSARANPQV